MAGLRFALIISTADLRAIDRQALEAWPEECCGILIGVESAKGREVERVVPAANVWEGERGSRFAIAPADLLRAHQEARAEGRVVVGYYHSHPEGPARPSAFDRERAWPGESHLIVAVDPAGVLERRCWRRGEGEEGFREEAIRYPPGEGSASDPSETG